jgi:hypothetical protein
MCNRAVFRKNKERGSSPCPAAVSKEVTRCEPDVILATSDHLQLNCRY